jgi:hypothetical protein
MAILLYNGYVAIKFKALIIKHFYTGIHIAYFYVGILKPH